MMSQPERGNRYGQPDSRFTDDGAFPMVFVDGGISTICQMGTSSPAADEEHRHRASTATIRCLVVLLRFGGVRSLSRHRSAKLVKRQNRGCSDGEDEPQYSRTTRDQRKQRL